jgi:hypothetical protein
LAIVDVVLGEASPPELQQLLAMPSHRLAHHVRVLEKAGVGVPPPLRGRPPPHLLPVVPPRRRDIGANCGARSGPSNIDMPHSDDHPRQRPRELRGYRFTDFTFGG